MAVTIALAQYPITRHADLASWKAHTEHWVKEAASHGAQLLVFPEYGSMELVSLLGDVDGSDLAQQLEALQELLHDFLETFEELADAHDCVIVAPSFPVMQPGDRFVNRAYVFGPRGVGYQDKWFMTRFENEEWGISAGEKRLALFEAEWGAFGVQICYDIEFPYGAQYLSEAGAGLIVAPSCTETIRGAARVHVGARARALEQQLYVGVAQTIGEAQWSAAVDLNYGFAAVYSSPDKDLPEEGIVAIAAPQEPQWLVTEIDPAKNEAIRRDGQVFNRKDMQRAFSADTTVETERIRV